MRANADWFRDAKWGVFMHFLAEDAWTSDEWNRRVDAFDVDGLARQLAEVGAGYFFITLGQNSGHYCAPNAAYDRIVGIRPTRLSRRDLVLDLADALAPHGIALLVYHPSGAPDRDPVAMERLEWQKFDYGTRGERLAAFQRKWEVVIAEWSRRWGSKCRGWWFDGAYFADAMYRHAEPPNFASLAAVAKAGNPDSLVAFNPGVKVPIVCLSEHEDYTAGEINDALPVWQGYDDRPGRFVDGAQYQILSFLGPKWCAGTEPRFPDALIIGYTQHVNAHGGVVTWDVPRSDTGIIHDAFVRQLAALRKATR